MKITLKQLKQLIREQVEEAKHSAIEGRPGVWQDRVVYTHEGNFVKLSDVQLPKGVTLADLTVSGIPDENGVILFEFGL
jgi:hypothetical protein